MSRKTQRRHKTYKHPQYVERKRMPTEDKFMEMLKKAFPTAFMKDVELKAFQQPVIYNPDDVTVVDWDEDE